MAPTVESSSGKPAVLTILPILKRGSVLLVLLAALALCPIAAAAQVQATVAATKNSAESRSDFKVIKWALPHLDEERVLDLLALIEQESFRYNMDYQFAVAVVAAESSFNGTVAVARRRNIDLYRIMSKAGGGGSYPHVADDLANAISTLADLLRSERTTKDALTAYWADSSTGQNKSTLAGFLQRVGEKYALMEGMSEEQAQKNYVREIEKFPEPPVRDAFPPAKEMPNLNKLLVKYDVEDQYLEVAQYFNSKLSNDDARKIARSVLSFSMQAEGVDPRLVMALIAAESRFNPRAVSKKGAMGLAQLMPSTARSHGIRDAFDPVQNVYVCVQYLEREVGRWKGRKNWLDLVLASYNAGPGAVQKYGGVPPYQETKSFVRVVKGYYSQLGGNV
jgi:soluble lytic murein transglycosylase-like protein